MKKILFFAAFLLVSAMPSLFAQVTIEMNMSQMNYVQYEPVYLRMSVRNLSAHPLAFGESDGLRGQLRFDITTVGLRAKEFALPFSKKVLPDLKGTIIPPGGVKRFTFKISQYYDLRKLGKYAIKAVISHPQLTSDYESEVDYFNVITGRELWHTTVGLPQLDDSKPEKADKKIETRNYRLMTYFTGRVYVYMLQIDDKRKVYLLKRIGFELGQDLLPKCEVDFLSRLNIMVAASPKVFAYYQYNVDGVLEKKQIYIKTSTTPSLSFDETTGAVIPVGGRIAQKDKDYEEIRDLPFMESMDEKRMDVFGDAIGDLPNPEGPRKKADPAKK